MLLGIGGWQTVSVRTVDEAEERRKLAEDHERELREERDIKVDILYTHTIYTYSPYLTTCQPTYPPTHLPIHLPANLPTYLPTYLPASTYLPTYLPTYLIWI
jgi:hypothetical protein